jgi:hypothetical protein
MQNLQVSGAVRPLKWPLGVKWLTNIRVGRDSSVSIATRYELDGPGIESRWQRDFPHPFSSALGPTQSPIQWVLGLSHG